METLYFESFENEKIQCTLCPHNCLLKEGQAGKCSIRVNEHGVLVFKTLNIYSAINFDPIEKKPLYHFYPGKTILSVGSFGCNMHCSWCQNYIISQKGLNGSQNIKELTAEELYGFAKTNKNNIGVAFTYNEPSISFETNIKTAKLFYERGLKNIMVTNGYINTSPLKHYLKYLHAINLDVKCFNSDLHKKTTGADLSVILNNAIEIYKTNTHLELTYLIIPEVNDNIGDFKNFVAWIALSLSKDIPLHISRYYPCYKCDKEITSADKLVEFSEIAKDKLNYVYVGNAPELNRSSTYCPDCSAKLICRNTYNTDFIGLTNIGSCNNCGKKIVVM